MAQISMQAAEKVRARVVTGEAARLYFIDYLRAALVILVVLHHLAVVYGEGVAFWYVDPPQTQSLGSLVLFIFVLFNQAWFMGALFLLAGYFTPGSYDRKGASTFLKERLIRIGIPLLVWIFVLNPLCNIGLYLEPNPRIPLPLTWTNFWQMYPEFVGFGVAWFLALLLIFVVGYALWRRLTANRSSSQSRIYAQPGYVGVGLFIVGLAVVSYVLRTVIPIGRTVLDFPTIAYLPQYLSFFVVGIIAFRGDWFRTIPDKMGKVGFLIAVAATLILFPIIVLGILGGSFRFLGNGTWPSAVYALWDSAFAVGLCLASITFFRHYFNRQSSVGTFLAQQSYAVYIIHSPIIVLFAYLLHGIAWGPLQKFALAAIIVVPICYAAAYILRKIPGVSRVL